MKWTDFNGTSPGLLWVSMEKHEVTIDNNATPSKPGGEWSPFVKQLPTAGYRPCPSPPIPAQFVMPMIGRAKAKAASAPAVSAWRNTS